MKALLQIAESDNLATCLKALKKGETVQTDEVTICVTEDIPQFHKIALQAIPKGAPCRKYGEIIGIASADIPQGAHAHVHNIESTRGRGDKQEGGAQ